MKQLCPVIYAWCLFNNFLCLVKNTVESKELRVCSRAMRFCCGSDVARFSRNKDVRFSSFRETGKRCFSVTPEQSLRRVIDSNFDTLFLCCARLCNGREKFIDEVFIEAAAWAEQLEPRDYRCSITSERKIAALNSFYRCYDRFASRYCDLSASVSQIDGTRGRYVSILLKQL